MIKAYDRGWEIYFNKEQNKWLYIDTDKELDENRQCKNCGCKPTKEGYDACIGHLEGVKSACCGHGKEKAYVVLENGEHMSLEEYRQLKDKLKVLKEIGY